MALSTSLRLAIYREFLNFRHGVKTQARRYGVSQSAVIYARQWAEGYEAAIAEKEGPPPPPKTDCGWNRLSNEEQIKRYHKLVSICIQ